MTKLELLWIRGCKSSNPRMRLASIYRRFYCKTSEPTDKYILSILLTVCEKHVPIAARKLVSNFLESNDRQLMLGVQHDTSTRTFYIVIMNHIRFTVCSEIKGYVHTIAVRRNHY